MDDLELIKEKVNIVDLIQEYIPLKKSGINFKANCPFHQEKTASFMVSPERQIWHCFGCDRGGDIFKFLMEKEGLEFKDALEILAQKAGVVLKKGKGEKSSLNEKLFEINFKAAQYYHYILTSHNLGKKALDYLKRRGLNEETIKTFQIGYAPNDWESLSSFLKKKGFTDKELILSGLGVPSKRGCYDRFRGRIVFPLLDVRNRVMGFSGRVLDDSLPKYINTPATPIFDKGKFLFGLNLTKADIKLSKAAILVEGEMDMLMSYQCGVKQIVASKGTALTEDQLTLIKKYTDTLLLCFDTDLAGDEASRRGIELAEREGFNLKVVKIPAGKDPGELVLKDPALWKKAVEEATPIYDYYLDSVSKRIDLKSPFGKKEAFSFLLPIWKKIPDHLVREHYIQRLATLLQVQEEMVREELDKFSSTTVWKDKVESVQSREPSKKGTEFKAEKETTIETFDRRKVLEEYLISLLLHIPEDHTYVPTFPETLLTTEELKSIYVLLVLFLDSISFKGKALKISEFIKTVPPESGSEVDRLYLMQLDDKLSTAKYWQKEVDGVLTELKKMLIKSSLEKLSLEIKSAQQFEKVSDLEILNKRFRDLSVKLKNL